MRDMQMKLTSTAPISHHHPSCGTRSRSVRRGSFGMGLLGIDGGSDADGAGEGARVDNNVLLLPYR